MDQNHVTALCMVPAVADSLHSSEELDAGDNWQPPPLQGDLNQLPINHGNLFSVAFHAGGVTPDCLFNVLDRFLPRPSLGMAAGKLRATSCYESVLVRFQGNRKAMAFGSYYCRSSPDVYSRPRSLTECRIGESQSRVFSDSELHQK